MAHPSYPGHLTVRIISLLLIFIFLLMLGIRQLHSMGAIHEML